MTVKVKTTRRANSSRLDDEHKTANSIDVRDGHLFVYSGQRTVAVHAPGDWVTATVEQDS